MGTWDRSRVENEVVFAYSREEYPSRMSCPQPVYPCLELGDIVLTAVVSRTGCLTCAETPAGAAESSEDGSANGSGIAGCTASGGSRSRVPAGRSRCSPISSSVDVAPAKRGPDNRRAERRNPHSRRP